MKGKRRGRRKRIGKGLYRDSYGLSATVKVGTGLEAVQREKRFAFDTPHKELRAWQDDTRAELRRLQRRPVAAVRGTLTDDVTRYLTQVQHLASYKSRVCEVHAWTDLYGSLRRAQLTAAHVREARGRWLAPKQALLKTDVQVGAWRRAWPVEVVDRRRSPASQAALGVAEPGFADTSPRGSSSARSMGSSRVSVCLTQAGAAAIVGSPRESVGPSGCS